MENSKNEDSATNTKQHIILVDVKIKLKDILENTERILLTYKNDIEVLKSELNLMKNRITNFNEETKNTIVPASENLQRDLNVSISQQKDENNRS